MQSESVSSARANRESDDYPVESAGAGLLVVESSARGQSWISSVARVAFPNKAMLVTRTSREAAEALRRFPCDLVLVDLQLADASGVGILEEAARLQPQAHCIVVTALDDDEHIFAALAAGAKGYLLKNQPRRLLLEQLRQLAHGVPALSAPVVRRLVEHFHKTPRASQRRGDGALSSRERDVLRLLARGQRIIDVAATLHISSHTVCTHIKNIYRKLSVSTRAEAALQAQRMGLV